MINKLLLFKLEYIGHDFNSHFILLIAVHLCIQSLEQVSEFELELKRDLLNDSCLFFPIECD